MQRPDLLIAFLAFGAAVSTLMAWMWATVRTSASAPPVRRRSS